MHFLCLILNLLALGALFTNHRLAATSCFFAYSAINLFFLFQRMPTPLDPAFFVVQSLSVLVAFVALSAKSRDQVLTHQKKRASVFLLVWALILALFFGHWLLALKEVGGVVAEAPITRGALPQGETFMLLAVVILWMVGKNLYDRR